MKNWIPLFSATRTLRALQAGKRSLSRLFPKPLWIMLALYGLSFPGNGLMAQTTNLHVITKRLEKTFKYRETYEVNIEGEKADVSIETWNKDEIGLTVEFIAKHPDKTTAEADIEAIKYIAERVRNKIYVRNYISVPEGAPKPASNLSARYVV